MSTRDLILVGVGIVSLMMVLAPAPEAVELKLVDTQHQQVVNTIQQQAGNL